MLETESIPIFNVFKDAVSTLYVLKERQREVDNRRRGEEGVPEERRGEERRGEEKE